MDKRDVIMNLKLGTVGVKYEDFYEFWKSYFKYIYKSAYERLDDIIIQNREMLESKSHDEESRYNEISNILTFVGKRGTGKTSAMLSFMESLKSYDKILSQCKKEEMFYTFEHKDVLFTCLDCIDGSLLEKGEDIFQIVLAEMYQKFEYLYNNDHLVQSSEGEYGYQARELHKDLEKLYKQTCALEEMAKRSVKTGSSYMNDLRTLASSQQVKKEFAKLLGKYLQQIRYRYRSSREMGRQHFLVITVDDIDLNIENGFSMLEKIHRYLMLPNVIVLLSMDYQEMLQICMKKFYKVLRKYDSALTEGEEFVREVSVDYLDKVLPINYRVYMPDINERYAHYKINDKKMKQGAKELLFGKLFQKSGVLFDSQGLKHHFYEPKSVRIFADFYKSLEHLENLPAFWGDPPSYCDIVSRQEEGEFSEQQRRIYNICEKNYHFFHYDLGTRMASSLIDKEQQRRFFTEKVMKSNMARAMERVIDYVLGELKKRRLEADEDFGELYKWDDAYNYGTLLNILYELGRIDNGDYKPLSCCLLAYFSYELTKVYILENAQDKGQFVENGRFKEYISDSIVGNWEAEMIPRIKIAKKEAELRENPFKRIPDSEEFDTTRKRSISIWFDISLPLNTDDDVSKFLEAENLQERILEIEILYLSLSGVDYSEAVSGDWKVEIAKVRGEGSESKVKPHAAPMFYLTSDMGEKVSELRAWFSIFNFVENSLNVSSELAQLEQAIIEGFKNYYGENNIPDIPSEQLLSVKYREWEKGANVYVALPVYSVDLMYNVFKRVRRNAKRNNPLEIERHEVFRYVRRIYHDISEQLKKQDDFYATYYIDYGEIESEALEAPSLYTTFTTCPYVAYFLNGKITETKQRFMADIVHKVIWGTRDE